MTTFTEAWEKNPNCQQCRKPLTPTELRRGDRICASCIKTNKGRVWGSDKDDMYTEGKVAAILIATPKESGDKKGFYRIGDDVFKATIDGPVDVDGFPTDKRWEASFTHFTQFWSSVYERWYTKTPKWTATPTAVTESLWDIVNHAITYYR